MNARFLAAIVSALIQLIALPRVWAQCPTIADSVEIILPTLTATVLRDVTAQDGACSGSPLAWECRAPDDNPPRGVAIGVDAAGNAYDLSSSWLIDFDSAHRGFLLERLDRTGKAEPLAKLFTLVSIGGGTWTFGYGSQFQFDLTNGRIVVPAYVRIDGIAACPGPRYGLIEISGLPRMFDTLLTFVPGGQTLSILTPAHPDGFRSADSLELWTGEVRALPDWSQATPVACPAAVNASPGQLVSVADTLPDPVAGHASYYVVASQNGTQRRLGRQYVGGAFSGRDPTTLPACNP